MRWLVLVVVACSGVPASPHEPAVLPAPKLFAVKVSGSGRPVILIPGLGCPGAVWDETVAHLGAGYQTHELTMAGFAGQPVVDGASIASTRDELIHYIRERKLDKPIVIGHSLGGFLAYWIAETEPDLVGSIVVVDEALFLPSAIDPAATLDSAKTDTAQFRDQMLSLAPAEFTTMLRTMFTGMTANPDRLEPTIVAVTQSDQRTIANEIYELFTTDLRPDAARIRIPALVVFADGPLAKGATAQVELLPAHQIEVVPKAKHFVMTDEPAAFFAVLDAFLARHPVH